MSIANDRVASRLVWQNPEDRVAEYSHTVQQMLKLDWRLVSFAFELDELFYNLLHQYTVLNYTIGTQKCTITPIDEYKYPALLYTLRPG